MESAPTKEVSFRKESDLTISPMVFRVRYNPKAIRTLIQTMCKRIWVGEDAFEFISTKITDSKSDCLIPSKNTFPKLIVEIIAL